MGAVERSNLPPRIAIVGKCDPVVVQKLLVGVRIFVGTDAQHDHTGGLEGFGEGLQGRGFLDTGRAPAGPEMQDDHVTPKVGQACRMPVSFEDKVRCTAPRE